jgi:hypothetical protein
MEPVDSTREPGVPALPALIALGAGVALALVFYVFFDDSRAGWIAVMLTLAGVVSFFLERRETADRGMGSRLAQGVGGESLATRWDRQVLGTWWSPHQPACWIVGREEPWGSVYLLRLQVTKNGRDTQLVLDVQGAELPSLSAERGRPADRELIAPEEWNVTAAPGADEEAVRRIVHLVQPLGITAFQCEGTKLWCRARDPGPAFLGDNTGERLQALGMLFQRAAETGRELARRRA